MVIQVRMLTGNIGVFAILHIPSSISQFLYSESYYIIMTSLGFVGLGAICGETVLVFS